MTKNFANFADFAEFYANETEGSAEAIHEAMSETNPTSQLSVFDEPTTSDMPDPFVMQRAIEMIMQTTFDALRDTRLEEFAQDITWGFVNSLHMTAKRIANREDDSAKKLGELLSTNTELQRLAVDFGFRIADSAYFVQVAKATNLAVEERLTQVIDPPSFDIMAEMIDVITREMAQ